MSAGAGAPRYKTPFMNTSYHELSRRLEAADRRVALLPIGCMEQHGPELPLETDSLVAKHLCRDLAEERASFWDKHEFESR